MSVYSRPSMGNAPQKPVKGAKLIESRLTRKARVAAELKVMREAKRRDGQKCRNPRCEFKHLDLPVDACHDTHRGLGGNPTGDRTTLDGLISLCRGCHGLWDTARLVVEPVTVSGFSGACAWYRVNVETGRREHFATETSIGVSVTRS